MNKLSKYLSYGYTNPLSKYLSKVLPDRLILSLFVQNLKNQAPTTNVQIFTNTIPELKLSNDFVKELQLACAYYKFENEITLSVFGSIASDETINYSDFDGVLIYDENKFKSPDKINELKQLIKEINLLAHLQDSLQHHGIMVIGKNELIIQSNDIINNLILESKLIYGSNQVKLSNVNKSDYSNFLNKLINSIQCKLNHEENWGNQYFFKNTISELLLLPCSYLQNKNQNYLSKKDSFELIKSYISPQELTLIYQLEKIRRNWIQQSVIKSELTEITVNKIKLNSKTQTESIAILSEIKSDLRLLLIRLKPND